MVKEAENEFKNLKVNLAVEDRINKFMTGLSNFRTQIDSHKNYLRSKISYEDPLENGKIIILIKNSWKTESNLKI